MVDQYAVIGNPISHSKSPLIHEAFAKQLGQTIRYTRILAPLDGFQATVQQLMQEGYRGVNITVPFKFEAFQLCEKWPLENGISIRAQVAGAVNTLVFDNQILLNADNTDGVGLVNDIEKNLGVDIVGKNVLLLGAGGAASGVVLPVLTLRPQSLTIANRTLQNARQLRKKILNLTYTTAQQYVRDLAQQINCVTFEECAQQSFDLIINATSAGLSDIALPIPDSVFAKNCLAYDMMYGRETPFMTQARVAGAQVADGLGMLVEQAAEAFFLWRAVRPDTIPVIKMLRANA